jgi:hypothetical protein
MKCIQEVYYPCHQWERIKAANKIQAEYRNGPLESGIKKIRKNKGR